MNPPPAAARRCRAIIVHAAGRSTRVAASEVHAAFLEAGWRADLSTAESLRYRPTAGQRAGSGHADAVVSIGALAVSLRFAATQPNAVVLVASGAEMVRHHLAAGAPRRPATAVAAAAIQFARHPDEMLIGAVTISSSIKGRAVTLGGIGLDAEAAQVWHARVEAPVPASSNTGSVIVTVTVDTPGGSSTVRLQPDDHVTITTRHHERLRVLLDDGQLLEVDGPVSVRRHPIGVPLIDLTAPMNARSAD